MDKRLAGGLGLLILGQLLLLQAAGTESRDLRGTVTVLLCGMVVFCGGYLVGRADE